MSAFRWLSNGDWAGARLTNTIVARSGLTLSRDGSGGYVRHGTTVVWADRPSPAQNDTPSADRWRRVGVRLAQPLPPGAWLRLWTRVEQGGVRPPDPDPRADLTDQAPVDTPPGIWRAASVDALDARVLCRSDGGLWVAVELGGPGSSSAVVANLIVATGDDGPVTELPVAYRGGPKSADLGDELLGRYLGLLDAELRQTSSLLDELPALLSTAAAPDRVDAPWLRRLAEWVALAPEQLPGGDVARRETIATAVERHARRGTLRGLCDEVLRQTGLAIEVFEPLEDASVWRLGDDPVTSALGLTTGLLAADPGPPTLDRTALLDASMLIAEEDAGLPVHAHVAHRICVHVPGGDAADVDAVDAVVQRERPAHVLARTCTTTRQTSVPTVVGVDSIGACATPGLGVRPGVTTPAGPGARLGSTRIHRSTESSVEGNRDDHYPS